MVSIAEKRRMRTNETIEVDNNHDCYDDMVITTIKINSFPLALSN